MSITIESTITHRIELKIPEVVLRDAIVHLLMNHLREELKGANLEVLLDEHNNSKEVARRLEAVAARMIQHLVIGDPIHSSSRNVEIPFSFITGFDL